MVTKKVIRSLKTGKLLVKMYGYGYKHKWTSNVDEAADVTGWASAMAAKQVKGVVTEIHNG